VVIDLTRVRAGRAAGEGAPPLEAGVQGLGGDGPESWCRGHEGDCPDSAVTGPTRQRCWLGRLVTDDRDKLERELDAEEAGEEDDARGGGAGRGAGAGQGRPRSR
jgi:hypothetical protein